MGPSLVGRGHRVSGGLSSLLRARLADVLGAISACGLALLLLRAASTPRRASHADVRSVSRASLSRTPRPNEAASSIAFGPRPGWLKQEVGDGHCVDIAAQRRIASAAAISPAPSRRLSAARAARTCRRGRGQVGQSLSKEFAGGIAKRSAGRLHWRVSLGSRRAACDAAHASENATPTPLKAAYCSTQPVSGSRAAEALAPGQGRPVDRQATFVVCMLVCGWATTALAAQTPTTQAQLVPYDGRAHSALNNDVFPLFRLHHRPR